MTPDLLIEIASRHAVYLEGHKTHAAKEFDTFLKAMERDILARVSGVDTTSLKGQRLTKILRAVRKTLDNGFGDYEKVWRDQLRDLGAYEAEFELRALGQVVKADFTLPTPTQIYTSAFAKPLSVNGVDGGSLLSPFYESWTGRTSKRIEGAIRIAAAQGQSTQQLVRAIRGTRAAKYRDGLIQATRREVGLMARTAMQHVAAEARVVTWQANADLIRAMEFVAVLDGRTSTICRGLSGRTFKLGKGPQPPLHIACRSVLVPVLKSGLDMLDDGGEQFSRGADGVKRVSADMDYYDFLKTQPKAFQDDVLGATRGKLLRNGGLTADRFRDLQLNSQFKPLTIEQMREREPLAFAKAGL